MNFNFISQLDEKDCGVACLAMILKHYKTEIPIHKLRELSGTDLDGTSAFGLKKTLEKLDFDCLAIQADNDLWKEKELPLPLIAHVIIDNKYPHYVVVYGIKDTELLIADPGRGKLKKSVIEFNKEWTGVVLIPTPKEIYQPTKEKIAGLTSFFPIIWKQKGLVFHIILASIFITLFNIGSSYYFQGLLDYFIPNQARSTLNIISIGLIVVYLFRVLFEYSRSYLLLILGQRMSISIMLSYFKHVLNLPMTFFATRKSGEILSRFLDANKIIDALASATLSVFLDVGMVLIVGITLLIQNHMLFFITLASIPFYLVTILAFVKSYEKANQEEMNAGAMLNSSMIESLKGIETVKAYNGEEQVYQKVDTEFIKLMKKSFKTVTLDNAQQGLKHGIQLINSALILWAGSYYVMNGTISLGQLITYNALLVFFTDPLQNIINLQVKMQTAQVANKRLNEIFAISPEQKNRTEKRKYSTSTFQQGISIENLSFSYNMKAPTLKNIFCTIPPNSKIAWVGLSGSGKSTLAKLLVHFYEANEGSISYGKINGLDISHEELRNHVTYIPQESFFFSGTIFENLIFGLTKIPSFEQILEVCDAVQLTEFINQQTLRFDTVLEEGATNLSGGQRQRLAIARALLKNSPILILDEATSGLDKLLEHEIMDYLLNLENKTLIFIAHHLSIAKSCDKIMVLHEGELVEEGTHESLRYNGGIYQKLWEI
ncbi:MULTISPECIES: peptide cleavage/export ABC transporter [Enterococcus]|uniref:Bacteriocin-processing/bacteriocin ABC transporter, ATP-binding protein n=5 Tax=Enterococcus TaxID=1350 RepID=A0AB73ADF7_ENTFC|nr:MULTISPECIES: peptide cleavage/export ABC transporter [Enterococcus]EFF37072.1 ABC transporter CbaT [Enterococcus faecium E980]EGP5640778.1 peptide cleavage/export ABC transporter [Enterococcus faecium]EPI16629.1 bacteriocin-processing/bacteriocin ABC transporter, ATP-binding protein [Enterococcus faecium SD2A-2]KST46840.1 peptide ABC transporter ATP-binding protein [Enterococcus faecium]MBX9042261.1 peptide cleavage/export ABC transporter [Enterococcus durans]